MLAFWTIAILVVTLSVIIAAGVSWTRRHERELANRDPVAADPQFPGGRDDAADYAGPSVGEGGGEGD